MLAVCEIVCSHAIFCSHPVHLWGAKPPLSLKPSDAPGSD